MTFIPQDGEDLTRLAFSSPYGDIRALDIIHAVVDDVCANSKDITDVKDITQRGSIEANLGNIKTAIEMGKLRSELRQFRIASEIQKQFWEATEHKKRILPEFPHHENMLWSGAEEKWVSKSELVIIPLSYVFGPIITNPYSFEKTPEENISYVADVHRITDFIERTAEYFGTSPNELATAGSVYCHNVVGKRAWSIANKGDIEPGQVGPEHFLAVDRAIQATGYGMDFTRG